VSKYRETEEARPKGDMHHLVAESSAEYGNSIQLKMKIIGAFWIRDNVFGTECEKRSRCEIRYRLSFRSFRYGGRERGEGGKEIRKRDSREDYENRFGTNGIIVLPGASGISTEKGFHRGLLRRRY